MLPIPRTVTEDDLARLKRDREEADRKYNDALTALDAAVQTIPDLPHPPPGPDEFQVTPLNERWNILTAAPPMPAGWRGRLARFIWNLVEPIFTRQQAFNSALVDHVNRNIGIEREVPKAMASTIALVRQQIERSIHFQSHLILLAQRITPFVDTKDYEFDGIRIRTHEDALEATARVRHRLGELIQNEMPFALRRVEDAENLSRGVAAGLSGVSEEMLKRFESATARDQRFEAGLGELTGAIATMQQLTQMLRRDLERRVAGTPATSPSGIRLRSQDSRASYGETSPERPGGREGGTHGTPEGVPSGVPVEGTASAVPGGAQQLLASDPIHSHQYVGFEDLYRGSEIDIKGRMADYVQIFAGASDVLDIGCGRGELLTLLKEHGVTARGLDLNHEMVARCQAEGLDVTEADALTYLTGLPDESLGGLIATQVVEHLPPDYLLRLLTAAFDKLRPNARLVLETINPASWAAFFDSYIRDLTHVRPVHPDTLKYLVTASGFADASVSWRSPYPDESKLRPLGAAVRSAAAGDATLAPLVETFDHNVERLNGLFFTYMDYAVIARRP